MKNKTKDDFQITPERKEFYIQLVKWSKLVNIPFKRPKGGIEVSITNIPKKYINEWIERCNFDNYKK